MNASILLAVALVGQFASAVVPTVKDEIILNGAMERLQRVAWVFQECVATKEECGNLADEDEEARASKNEKLCEDDEKPLACFVR